jgi:hypothetical protein
MKATGLTAATHRNAGQLKSETSPGDALEPRDHFRPALRVDAVTSGTARAMASAIEERSCRSSTRSGRSRFIVRTHCVVNGASASERSAQVPARTNVSMMRSSRAWSWSTAVCTRCLDDGVLWGYEMERRLVELGEWASVAGSRYRVEVCSHRLDVDTREERDCACFIEGNARS